MNHLLKSLLVTSCLLGSAAMLPGATPPEVGEQYIQLATEWREGPKREDHLTLAEDFLKLSEKSEEYTFKARCKYNAAKIHREAGDREGCLKLLREVVAGYEAPDVHMTVGRRSAFEYSALALQELYEMTPPGKERENHMMKLAVEYAESGAAKDFIRLRGMELFGGAIDQETWEREVFAFLDATGKFHDRYYSDIVFVVDVAARRRGIKDDVKQRICERTQESARRHPNLAADSEMAKQFNETKMRLDKRIAAARDSRLDFKSIQDLPKIHDHAEESK